MEIMLDDNSITTEDNCNFIFKTPYEISLTDTRICSISSQNVIIDIGETEAQETVSQFVTDIAHKCGLDITISMKKIMTLCDFKTVSIHSDDTERIRLNPQMLVDSHVDVDMEWDDFIIKDNNILVKYVLTNIVVKDMEKPKEKIHNFFKTPSIEEVIKENSSKIHKPNVAPDLYYVHKPFGISYHIV